MTVVEGEPTEPLTPMEEKVIRMLHGLSEGDSHELSYAVGASEETIERLALMEESILSSMYEDVKDVE